MGMIEDAQGDHLQARDDRCTRTDARASQIMGEMRVEGACAGGAGLEQQRRRGSTSAISCIAEREV